VIGNPPEGGWWEFEEKDPRKRQGKDLKGKFCIMMSRDSETEIKKVVEKGRDQREMREKVLCNDRKYC